MKSKYISILICFLVAIPAWILGKLYPVIGAPVLALLFGVGVCTIFPNLLNDYRDILNRISKKTLQFAVILLGFGLNLNMVLRVGKESLPIIVSTISISLIIAFILCKLLKIPVKTSILIGVGSSICGGSAIAATAPVIEAENDDVAQSISVIFLFNLIAALIFPSIGIYLGMGNNAFGIFAGTAINDTSSVTAAASSWDSIFQTGTTVLDIATVVKLTRTLAIIPITFFLSLYYTKKENRENKYKLSKLVPSFILLFIICSCITSITDFLIVNDFFSDSFKFYSKTFFSYMKILSKFLIIIAMTSIGLNTSIYKILKSGFKTIILGLSCWIGIILVSLLFLIK